MEKTINVTVIHVAKTTEQWSTETAIAPKGMLLIEFTEAGLTNLKVGDGVNQFSSLPYASAGQMDLADYYTKAETDGKIADALGEIGTVVTIKGVADTYEDLPTEGNKPGDLWFVGIDSPEGSSEYIWIEYEDAGRFEYIGKVIDSDISELPGRIDALEQSVTDIESEISEIKENYISTADTLILNCVL